MLQTGRKDIVDRRLRTTTLNNINTKRFSNTFNWNQNEKNYNTIYINQATSRDISQINYYIEFTIGQAVYVFAIQQSEDTA